MQIAFFSLHWINITVYFAFEVVLALHAKLSEFDEL